MEDKMIEQVDLRKHPGERKVKTEEVIRRRDHLTGLGFPVDFLDSLVQVRSTFYDPIMVDEHMKWLEDHRFQDPVKLISSSPAIFGLATENIDRRLRLFDRLIHLYNLPFEPVGLMEQDSYLFSTKLDKFFVLARILRHYQVTPSQLNEKLIGRLLRANLEDVLIAFNEVEQGSIDDLLKKIPQVWKRKIPREEKRQIIAEELQEAAKIKDRYFRGYPIKEN